MSDTAVFGLMCLIVAWLLYAMGVAHRRAEERWRITRVKQYRFPDSHRVDP